MDDYSNPFEINDDGGETVEELTDRLVSSAQAFFTGGGSVAAEFTMAHVPSDLTDRMTSSLRDSVFDRLDPEMAFIVGSYLSIFAAEQHLLATVTDDEAVLAAMQALSFVAAVPVALMSTQHLAADRAVADELLRQVFNDAGDTGEEE
jgi:hypothetical protein